MHSVRLMFLALMAVPLGWAVAPAYSASSVVNAATGVAGEFAPNSIVSIYGTDLAYATQAAASGSGVLPVTLAQVTVSVGGISANLFYVSPTQINFLVPANLLPGVKSLTVFRAGVAGPVLPMTLKETAPGFFNTSDGAVIATHADGTVCTSDSPVNAEEIIVLYAVGLGRTDPDAVPGKPSSHAAPIIQMGQLAVLLNGSVVDASRIYYAGTTPGFAGLYQINLRVPVTAAENPEIRVFIGQQGSPSYLKLPMRLQ